MKITVFMLLASLMVCRVQAVNISGTVKNGAGSGMEGVTVRLGKADIATVTGSDGSFRLTDIPTIARRHADRTASGNHRPFMLEDGRFYFDAAQPARVTVKEYDCNGKLLFSLGRVISSRTRSIALSHTGNGVHIRSVSINDKQYAVKSVSVAATKRWQASSSKESAPEMLAKSASGIDDALLFAKDGYQLSRLAVTKSDTSGIQITMSPLVSATVTDADGNAYRTVRIGDQEWTAENLRTTKYNDGKSIAQGSYWFYNNATDAAAKKKWGALYNFAAVKTGKLAPAGWHVATDAEWDTLQNYLIAHGYNYDGALTGNNIAKSLSAKTDWPKDTDDIGAIGNGPGKNNASGFSAVPAGYRYYDGVFMDQGNFSFFWTATERDASYAWYRSLWYIDPFLNRSYRVTTLGCSVRLVRNN